jgi:transcriptional regulator with XRE-family HTH domain
MRTLRSDDHVSALMPELDRAAITARLRRSREEAGLTQHELAELLEVHFRSIQNYESPKQRQVPFDRLDEWARITGRTKEWLLHGDEPLVGLASAEERFDRIEEELRRVVEEMERISEVLPEIQQLLAGFAQLGEHLGALGAAARRPRARREPS